VSDYDEIMTKRLDELHTGAFFYFAVLFQFQFSSRQRIFVVVAVVIVTKIINLQIKLIYVQERSLCILPTYLDK